MGRSPCCAKAHTTKGAWTPEEDELLSAYVNKHGEGNWRSLPSLAGLQRCGKSCRLRWVNYLRPHLKRGNFTEQEDEAIINMHKAVGNRWSIIAGRLQGRTDNEIKNRWNTYIKKKLIKQGIDPKTHKPMMLDTVGLKTVVAGAGGVRGAVGASSSSVSSGTTSCDQDVGSANTSIRVREEHNRRYLNQHNNIGSQLLQPQARFQLFWLPPAAAASASGSSSPALVDLELSLGLPLLTTTPQSKSNISSSSSCSPDHTSRSATPSSPVCLCCRLATTDTDACSCQTDFTPAAVSNAAGNGVTNHHPNGQAFGIVHLGRFYAQSYGSS